MTRLRRQFYLRCFLINNTNYLQVQNSKVYNLRQTISLLPPPNGWPPGGPVKNLYREFFRLNFLIFQKLRITIV